MADIADRADAEQYWTRRAINKHRLALQPQGPSAHYCQECGARIPQARREAVPGVQLCVECAEQVGL
jgi:phage/conjugal plasmid C-4 type zinc finger TraR family protein